MSRTVPSVALQNPGSLVTAALWNSGPKALGDFYTAPPLFRGRRTTTSSTLANAFYAQPFDTTDVDTDSGHSNVSNNSRYTAQVAGWYLVSGYTCWAAAAGTFNVYAAVAVNGTLVKGAIEAVQNAPSDTSGVGVSSFIHLGVGDYVEIWAQQTSSGSVTTAFFADMAPSMNVMWIHS